MLTLPNTDLQVFPLCLGGNVFGWTADQAQSFRVLDAFREGGGNFIDTADTYSSWVPGNQGGESETILGRWLKARGGRERVVIATKVGKLPSLLGLSRGTIERAVEASLARLQTDYIDLYYAHEDDAKVPLEESLGAFDALVRTGKVRHIAASNYSPARLEESLRVAAARGLSRWVALQPHYNLLERAVYEDELRDVVARNGLSCLPYFALAKGFLSGKYRAANSAGESARAGAAKAYLDPRGLQVLNALDEVARDRAASVTAVALAWLRAQPTVSTPIASARTTEQVAQLLEGGRLTLNADDLAKLNHASR
ncbi:MAG TPA: aldo/keto reductase [Polyangiales bacterium]